MTDALTEAELNRRIDDLRAFEREYRARLRAFLLGQVAELDRLTVEAEPLFRLVRRAISDPGKVTPRQMAGYEGDELESLPNWQARAVMAVLRLHLKEDAGG